MLPQCVSGGGGALQEGTIGLVGVEIVLQAERATVTEVSMHCSCSHSALVEGVGPSRKEPSPS